MMKKITTQLLLIVLAIGSFSGLGQETPIRIGIHGGIPQLGLHTEYVTLLLNGRLGFKVGYETGVGQYPWYSLLVGNSRSDEISALSIGTNFYLFQQGKGLYLNANYVRINGELRYVDYDEGFENEYRGSYAYKKNDISLKIGALFGKRFYVRPEIGLFINPFPDGSNSEIILTANNGNTITNIQSTQFSAGDKLILSVGFGYSF